MNYSFTQLPRLGNNYYFADTAKAGDICVLLVPSYAELPVIRSTLNDLRLKYGGELVSPVHLTAQRFNATPRQVEALIPRLVRLTSRTSPLAFEGKTVEPFYSPFYNKEILKCRIKVSNTLNTFTDAFVQELDEVGIKAHFPCVPELITLLEAIEVNAVQKEAFVAPLFVARRLVLSKIRAPGRYDALFSASMSRMLEPAIGF